MPYDLVFYLNRDAITLDRARVVSPTDRRPAGLPSLVVGATLTCALYLIDGDGAAISTSAISPRLLIGSPGYAPPLVELEDTDFTEITDGWEFSLALTTSALIAAMGAETVSQATWLEINTTASSQLRVEYRAAGRLLPALYDPTAVYTTYADLVEAVTDTLAAQNAAETAKTAAEAAQAAAEAAAEAAAAYDATNLRSFAAVTGLIGGAATDLDGQSTYADGAPVISTNTIALLSYGRVAQWWQLIAGTDAEDPSAGVVRPDDYDASTNARIWVQL